MRGWAAALALSATITSPVWSAERGAEPGDFDFYVLSLSWSPSYCAAEGGDANPEQCDAKRPYAFVVHGLWPQYETGYPEFCRTRQPSRVPRRLVEAYRDVVPSAGLMGHQWRKHGSCSGLTQDDYFALLRKARERIDVPDDFSSIDAPLAASPVEVEQEFLAANPDLAASGIAVTCDNRYLREVRICLTRDLQFRSCAEVDQDSCQRRDVTVPPAR